MVIYSYDCKYILWLYTMFALLTTVSIHYVFTLTTVATLLYTSYSCGYTLCLHFLLLWLYTMSTLLTPVAIYYVYTSYSCGYTLCLHFYYFSYTVDTHFILTSFSCGYTMPLLLTTVATLCLYF